MFCTHCGAQVTPEATFCPTCGTRRLQPAPEKIKEQNIPVTKPNKPSTSFRFSEDEIAYQVENYKQLGLLSSYAGFSAFLFFCSAVITLIFVFLGGNILSIFDATLFIFMSIIMATVGGRWTFIIAMIFWTLEKGYQIAVSPDSFFIALIWWIFYMIILYKAFIVETRRN